MSLFAIADLHLSLGVDEAKPAKPMDIFKGWENYVEKLTKNWNGAVGENDTVIIAGDISWAQSLETALADLKFINDNLNGNKILLKGNHDYWWTTLSKMRKFSYDNDLGKIDFLHNNAFLVENIAVCGTRGWFDEENAAHKEKLLKREELRLETSVKSAEELIKANLVGIKTAKIYAFLHYPPIYRDFENHALIDVLKKYGIERCFYGHLHGEAHNKAVAGVHYGIEFNLISADFVGFKPLKLNCLKKI